MFALFISTTLAAPAADYVASFPGYGFTKFPHYSGFLNASAAEDGTYLHYWLATYTASDKPWTKAPTVLWLNGGPGASSLLGMLQEQGPLIIDSSGKLVENPYAWTDVANLIALESPAGVGYSYCAAMASGGSCANTDVSTAKAAYAALVDFFTKFPELQKNPFYITGESYAGVYCPTLAAEIVSGNMHSAVKIDLVGMAVGDPCTDTQAQKQSMDMLWYAHKNGLVQDNEYDFLVNKCGASMPSDRMAGEWVADKSARVVPSKPTRPKLLSTSANCTAAMRRYLVASSKGISQSWDHAFINELSFYSPAAEFRFDIPGTLNYHTAKWMMAADVKAALHVATAPVKAWPGPAPGWKYTSSYDACNAAPPGTKSMVDFYRELAPKLAGQIVVYNGDTDPCVSYEGTRNAIAQVGFDEVSPYRAWFFNYTAADLKLLQRKDLLFGPSLSLQAGGSQYGGSIVNYEHGLAFATVHGSGHMVPTFRPRAALQMLTHVVHNTSFAPPVPADAALVKMSDSEFDDFLDKWVMTAKGGAYVGK